MNVNDFLFAAAIVVIVFGLVAEYGFKKVWIGNLASGFIFILVSINFYRNQLSWMIVLLAPAVLLWFVRAYLYYPSVFERLKSGDMHVPESLHSWLFDKKTLAILKSEWNKQS